MAKGLPPFAGGPSGRPLQAELSSPEGRQPEVPVKARREPTGKEAGGLTMGLGMDIILTSVGCSLLFSEREMMFYELCVRRKKLQVFELWISWRV